MNMIRKFVLPLLLISLMSGCAHGLFHDVRGSGKRQKEKREVAAFTSISTEGAFEIDVVGQKALSLEIEGDDNILPLIGTDVSGNVLRIRNQRSYSVSEPIRIRISVPNLEGVSMSGAGEIEVSSLKNEKFEIDVNGAPNIRISGETNLLDVKTNGAGKIDTHLLRASKAIVNSNGVSKVSVHARDQLDVTVSGPSHVTYEGDPVVKKTVNGPGSVQKKVTQGS
jgi:hypothetical protein